MNGPPKCKLCGASHWGTAHKWEKGADAPEPVVAPKPTKSKAARPAFQALKDSGVVASASEIESDELARLRARNAELEPLAAQVERRRAYQRELMAKRRAEKRQ